MRKSTGQRIKAVSPTRLLYEVKQPKCPIITGYLVTVIFIQCNFCKVTNLFAEHDPFVFQKYAKLQDHFSSGYIMINSSQNRLKAEIGASVLKAGKNIRTVARLYGQQELVLR